jgi:excisionase family DNA binding protein
MDIRERLALRIPDAVNVSGLGQTTLYEAMQDGELPFVKVGARRLIMTSDLQAFLERHRVAEAV